jgi:endoglucanase
MLEVPPTPDGRPGEGDWDLWVEQIYLQVVKVVGFDSIRLPLCWSCYTGDEPPYAIESRYFERVDEVVRWALEVDLAVVLVMHSYWQMNVHPADHRQRYLALWRQIARHYWDWSPDLMFELLDEPGASMEADDWNALLPSVVAVVRESNPERTLIVGPAARNSVTALEQLQLPVDNHLVATVHLFEPQTFTHSGLAYLGHLPPGATWTGSAAEREALEGLLDQAQRFASSKGVPLYVGEFGSSVYADGASRLRYTAFVVGAMAAREMAWAYWDFGGWFRVYDCFNHHHAPDSTFQGTGWNEPLLSALLDT